ncbi:MAG: hypothetical protein HY908_32365 [Myxococcales bacterium]|nr:hypothetical protein [Myxococcales bacterium]
MLYGRFIWWLVLGILGISNLIIAKKPNAKELFDKVAPMQGWFGVVSALWGAWGIIDGLLNMEVLSILPIFWIVWVAGSAVCLCLGALMGVGVMKSFVKGAAAAEKLTGTVSKLAPFQAIFGFILIGAAVFLFLDFQILHL